MLSTEYLFVHYVVTAANDSDPEMCITLHYDGAMDILRDATTIAMDACDEDVDYDD
jgi:hypothetical protein